MNQSQLTIRSIPDRLAVAREAGARLFRAPGRVNVIGEHVDYNDGLVLPTNTALYTWLTVAARPDRVVSVASSHFDETESFHVDSAHAEHERGWISYVRGVTAMLRDEGMALSGADIRIHGDIPLGGGLSSSASLEVAVATALLEISGEELPATRIAELCQAAEKEFTGVSCGIMDQYSVACGRSGQAMMLDCRTLDTQFVPIPDSVALVVTDSSIKHDLPDSGYNDRAAECRQSAGIIAGDVHSPGSLRDVTLEQIEARTDQLGDTLARRARHVVTEIQRARDALDAIVAGNAAELGALVSQSHASLRDDFEVSCDAIESLIGIADRCDGVYGSRMIGGGFGGCVLSVVEPSKAEEARTTIAKRYGAVIGSEPWTHVVTPADPAMEVCG